MKRGYARVSTIEQNLERQITALQEAGCDIIYAEKISGTKKDRPKLKKMLSELQTGDIVIVKELTRVSRSTTDMLQLIQTITDKGCFIKSINESWLDTSSPSGELMLTFFAGMAQFERRLLLQRTAEGRAIAISKGVQMGRPRKGGKQLDFAIQLYKDRSKGKKMSLKDICEVTGISRATLCRRLKELGLTSQTA